MPSMANITVKNAANADVILVSKVNSSGDKNPAMWTLDAASTVAGFRPKLQMVTRDNGGKTARIVEMDFNAPITGLVNGIETKLGNVPLKLYGTVPQGLDATKVQDAVVIATNAFVSAIARATFSEGYAPR